jgi:iron complex outermembrane receptor protein
MRRLLPSLLASVVALPLLAQQRPDSLRRDTIPPRLIEVIVEARAPLHEVGTAKPFQLKITSLSLPVAPTLDQVLRTLPMLHVRRNTRGETELSVRGSDSRQVAVLMDGIPLSLGWDGRVDASVIPAGAVHEVRFTRGLSSMVYGPNVLGGIVELSVGHSSQMPERASAQLSFGGNQTGGFGGTVTASAPIGRPARWLVRAGAEYSDSPGHPLASGIEEPVPASHGLRVNTDARTLSGFASLRYQSSTGPWGSFAASAFETERGIAAELGIENARFWRYPQVSRGLMVFSGGTGHHRALFGGTGDLEASLGVDLGRTEIDAFTDRTYRETSGFEDGNDRTLTGRLIGDHTLGSRADLRAAVTVADISHHEFLPDAEARYRQRLLSAGGETVIRLIEDGRAIESLRVTAGAALDAGRTPESGGRESLGALSEWGGRAAISAVLRGGTAMIHGGISRRARFPSLRELYSGALNRFAPNPELRPEKLVAAELGVTARIGLAELHAVGFRNRLRDAVVRITLPDRRFMRVNRDVLNSYGLELLGSVPVGSAMVGADLTLQHARITTTDSGEQRHPENLPSVFGAVYGRLPIGLAVTAGGEARLTGSQFCIDPGTGLDQRLGGAVTFNGELVRPWRIGTAGEGLFSILETRISVQNATNRALYDQCGLPEPGRVISFQIRVF